VAQIAVYAGAIMVLFLFRDLRAIPGKEETGAGPAAGTSVRLILENAVIPRRNARNWDVTVRAQHVAAGHESYHDHQDVRPVPLGIDSAAPRAE